MIDKNKHLEIIKDLKDISRSAGIEPSDIKETIFKESCSFMRGILAQEGKVSNMNFMKNISKEVKESVKKPSNSENKQIKAPTDKQLIFMEKNKLKIDKDLTREKASEIINKYIKNQQEFFKQ